MRSMMKQLISQLEFPQLASNWFRQQGWKFVELPEDNDALVKLDTLP